MNELGVGRWQDAIEDAQKKVLRMNFKIRQYSFTQLQWLILFKRFQKNFVRLFSCECHSMHLNFRPDRGVRLRIRVVSGVPVARPLLPQLQACCCSARDDRRALSDARRRFAWRAEGE